MVYGASRRRGKLGAACRSGTGAAVLRIVVVVVMGTLTSCAHTVRNYDGRWEGKPDCRVQIRLPAEVTSIDWSGPCEGGYANGTGRLDIKYKASVRFFSPFILGLPVPSGGGEISYEGMLVRGIRSGPAVEVWAFVESERRGSRDAGGRIVVTNYEVPVRSRYEGKWCDGRLCGPVRIIDHYARSYWDPPNATCRVLEGRAEDGWPEGTWRITDMDDSLLARGKTGGLTYVMQTKARIVHWTTLDQPEEMSLPNNGAPLQLVRSLGVWERMNKQGQSERLVALLLAVLDLSALNTAEGLAEYSYHGPRNWIHDPDSGAEVWDRSSDEIASLRDCRALWDKSPPSAPIATAKWSGDVHNGKASGVGRLVVLRDGSPAYEYAGPLCDGFMHGNGSLDLPDGTRHVGGFLRGRPSGRGTRSFPDGRRVDCLWEGDAACGSDCDILYGEPDGGYYRGSVSNSLADGIGYESLPDGSGYLGDWRAGAKSGKGIWLMPNGDRFVGPFSSGVANGPGVLITEGGERFAVRMRDGREVEREDRTAANATEVGTAQQVLAVVAVVAIGAGVVWALNASGQSTGSWAESALPANVEIQIRPPTAHMFGKLEPGAVTTDGRPVPFTASTFGQELRAMVPRGSIQRICVEGPMGLLGDNTPHRYCAKELVTGDDWVTVYPED